MSNTRPHTRVFALVGALLFFVTSCALTAAVLWQIHQDNQKPAANSSQTQSQGGKMPKLANFTPVGKVDSLQTTDTQVGTGQEAQATDTVSVKYTGAYASDGVIFDSSDMHGGQPISFALNSVIPGWSQGIPGMKVGGKRRLLIPAALAYGANPPQGIRANADMVFDVELISIGQPQQ